MAGSGRQSRRLPGIGSHHSARPQTDEWLTPPSILDAFAGTGFRFDLDPCVPLEPSPWPHLMAERTLNIEDDGLSCDWAGSVWLNPPYSEITPWMAKLAAHGDGVALVFARLETLCWFNHVWPHTTGLLFLEGRLTFCHLDGTPAKTGHNSGGPSVLVAYGDRCAEILAAVDVPGVIVRPPFWITRSTHPRRTR